MRTHPRFYTFLLVGLLLSAGCSALPGLRVLTGQDSPQALAEQVIEQTDLVMGDKSGSIDPSLGAAADRIEAANGRSVDIVQIGKNTDADSFDVALLWIPDGITAQSSNAEYIDAMRRMVELTWQGVLGESLGSDVIQIDILSPIAVDTLDNGRSFAAQVVARLQIPRSDVVAYLSHRPNSLQDFVNLVVDGKMQYQNPNQELYSGQTNHAVWMLSALQNQADTSGG